MTKHNTIKFHFLSPCTLQKRNALRLFIGHICRKEKIRLEELTIIFCSDEYLLSLNRQFLHHNYYTDILSFPLSPKHSPLVAEIYISVDRVRENASQASAAFKQEIHRVIFHGILHFCGYKDKTPAEIKLMRSMEDKCLQSYFK